MDVHNRDVINNILQDKTAAVTDFAWISQLRYYQTEEKVLNIQVKCINAV